MWGEALARASITIEGGGAFNIRISKKMGGSEDVQMVSLCE